MSVGGSVARPSSHSPGFEPTPPSATTTSIKTGFGGRLDPEEFWRDQRRKHAHVQVHQLGPTGGRWYVVIGYDEQWNESERTRLTEDGRILDPPEPATGP